MVGHSEHKDGSIAIPRIGQEVIVEFLEGDLDSAVFETASFDAIFAIFLLHHIDDQALERLAGALPGAA